MGDGTEQNPYTRKDVLRRIRRNGDTAEGLDLSGKVFEKNIDLRNLPLRGIILKKATLRKAHLEGAHLLGAHLERAFLVCAHLEGADLFGAHLEGVFLKGAIFSPDTELENVNWGDYKLGEENRKDFHSAKSIYRQLKQRYTVAGLYDIAGEFFFREMEAKRKNVNWRSNPWHRAWLEFVSFICGYGERPEMVFRWAAAVLLIFTFIYLAAGSILGWNFWDSLYFSAVSFTALGYGSWLQVTNDCIRGFGALESFIGVSTIALFLVTFVRKMTR